jgi:hypothetical protein
MKCEMIWKIWQKSKLNSDRIWKTQKKIVKWYRKYGRKIRIVNKFGKYRRKLWNDMENMDEMWNYIVNMEEKQVEKWKDMENMEERWGE